jgi:hypothetical protein
VNQLSATLTSLATAAPALLVLGVGILLALVTWRRHPRASLLATVGFVLVIVTRLVWLSEPFLVNRSEDSMEQIGRVYAVVSVVTTVLLTAGYLLVVMAVFVDRRGPYAPPRPGAGPGARDIPFADEYDPDSFRAGEPR